MNMYLQLAGAVAITLASFCGLDIPTANAANEIQPRVLIQAERALTRGKPQVAIELVTPRVEHFALREQRARGYALLCKAYFQLEAFAQAEQACDSAVYAGEEGANWSHLNNRGVMRMLLGRLGEAAEDFKSALHEKPKNRDVLRNRALLER